MNWNSMSEDRQRAILADATARLAIADDPDDVTDTASSERVTIADLADYVRNRPLSRSPAAVLAALQAPAMANAVEQLLRRYAKAQLSERRAADSDGAQRRRHIQLDVTVEWVQSATESSAIFVKIFAPDSMRPIRGLVFRGRDGGVRVLPFIDDGGPLQVVVQQRSPEHLLLEDEESQLWLA
jgi:hypothetical protein